MGHDAWSRLQLRRGNLSPLALHPRRTNVGPWFIFQSGGEIDNRTARIPGALPVLASGIPVRGEEGEVDVLKLFGVNPLNKSDFIAHSLELAQGFVIVKQPHIDGRKVAFIEHFGNFLSFERSSAHDRSPVKVSAGDWGKVRQR